MKIRRFYSHNVRTALKQVIDVFGDDAAILSNKKVAGGVEVIAALDYDESLMPSMDKIKQHSPHPTESSSAPESETDDLQRSLNNTNNAVVESKADKQAHPINKTSNEQDILSQKQAIFESMKADKITSATITQLKENTASTTSLARKAENSMPKQRLEWTMDPSLQAMREELELMRSMMSEQLKGIAWDRFTEKNPLKAMMIRRLNALGLDNESVNLLVAQIDSADDMEVCWQKSLALLAKSLPIADDPLLTEGGRYALIGPTGVGKTTCIAKLAARFVIKHGCDSVALISTDSHRITAQEQLATFGRILKVSMASVTEKHSLESLLGRFADKKLVLIDTAGVSSADSNLLKQLSQLTDCHKPIKKLLLMAATSQAKVLQQSLETFAPIAAEGLIITKLDEAASLGELISEVLKVRCPLYYTTDGQKIPEDIRQAKSHHVISKAVWLANRHARTSDEWTLAQTFEQVKSA